MLKAKIKYVNINKNKSLLLLFNQRGLLFYLSLVKIQNTVEKN